jgi:adenine specific DNA methylase Mod
MTAGEKGNALYYGDNLAVLRESIASDSVDLIYLDPPFNSQATYNVLFRSPSGNGSQAQIEAFEDTWHWGEEAESAFDQVMRSGNTNAADLLRAMRSFLGENDMMAYLAMMAVRLVELRRVLKPTGSFYLHCDPTASHYLKLLLDSIFGRESFKNEIVWQRSHDTTGAFLIPSCSIRSPADQRSTPNMCPTIRGISRGTIAGASRTEGATGSTTYRGRAARRTATRFMR